MTNQIYRKLGVFSFILILGMGLAPIASYARGDNDNNEDRNRNERVEDGDDRDDNGRNVENRSKNNRGKNQNNNNKSCRKIFRHLFSRNFFRNNDDFNFFAECLKPFGIEVKLNGTASTTSDIIAPNISRITTLVSTSTINIGWKTNENATSRVYYGTSIGLDVNASTTNFIENSALKKNHILTLSDLATSTTYYFALESKDGSNNKKITSIFSATTINN